MTDSKGESQLEQLLRENDKLKAKVARLKDRLLSERTKGKALITSDEGDHKGPAYPDDYSKSSLAVVVIGASGDLAWKKTFPALFSLSCQGLLPPRTVIAGYARSPMADADFKKQISRAFRKDFPGKVEEFLSRCFYFNGQYDSADDFTKFEVALASREAKSVGDAAKSSEFKQNRIFYLAIPPTIFVQVGKGIQPAAMSKTGWNRVIVEKPFGQDSASSAELGKQLSALFAEDQIYRIDHYLGKEMVQNLMVLRFANAVFEPIWNRHHIKSVQITFKEDFGTQGRGGYFDSFGIIRDVMQNHLLQILSLVAMEPPISMSSEDVRDEKVKLLRALFPILLEDVVIGQYGPDPKGKEPGYLQDKTVPQNSITPTFAAAVLHVNNARWKGVPFILKCGKALNERKAEVRIQFRKPIVELFPDISPNELVMRVQPDEAVYLKMSTKKPGLNSGAMHTELNLTYKDRFKEEAKNLPDAYERLILDVARGDHNLFVRADELVAAWAVFTPLLHKLDKERIKPIPYEFGSRGPIEADALVARYGYERTTGYRWSDGKEAKAESKQEAKSPTAAAGSAGAAGAAAPATGGAPHKA